MAKTAPASLRLLSNCDPLMLGSQLVTRDLLASFPQGKLIAAYVCNCIFATFGGAFCVYIIEAYQSIKIPEISLTSACFCGIIIDSNLDASWKERML